MKRKFILYYFLTIAIMFLLAFIYEFWLENTIHYFISGDNSIQESNAEHWEYILTSTIFSAMSLVLPMILLYRTNIKLFESEAARMTAQNKLDEALTKLLSGFVGICSYCKKVRVGNEATNSEKWDNIADYITSRTDMVFSHGCCPDCYKKVMQEIEES